MFYLIPFACAATGLVVAGLLYLNGNPQEMLESAGLFGASLICISIGCVCVNARLIKTLE